MREKQKKGDKKMKQAKGITLVTLVVTIIVILILSGITISTMTGENGILTKAAEAKQKTEIAALKEKISLIMLEWETDKALDPTVTVEDFWERLIDEGIIIDENDIGEPETVGNNKVYTIDTGDGYVMEMVVSPNGSLAMEDIAKGTDLPLKIKSIDVKEKSTNSISVEVRVRENEGKGTVKLSYYYKTGKGEYELLEEDTTDLTATFTGLQQGATYNIKVVAEKDGQTDELDINVKTENLAEQKVTASQVTWDATTNTASITLSTTTNYQIQYDRGGTNGEWITVEKGTKSIELTQLGHEDVVRTRLWDGYNGGYEDSITIEDKGAPIVTVTKGTVTSNSIQVTVSSVDNEWGMARTPTYKYYYKKKSDIDYPETEYKSSTETTCIFEELEQKTEYDIKVTTQDIARNTGTKELTGIKTGTVDEASENLNEGHLIASAPTWNITTHTASVTLSTTSNYQIQYQIGGIDGEWTTVEKGQNSTTISNLNHNDTIFARLWDGKNGGKEASVTVKDGQKPTVTVTEGTVTTNSIQVSVTSEDNEGGMPETPTYNYYYKKKVDADYPSTADKTGTETTWTFNGLDQKTEYDIKVTTEDKAGNEGEDELTAIETGTVDAAIEDLATAPIIASAPTWDTDSHTASITLSTDTNYQIQYQIGGINREWETVDEGQNSATISDLNHNDTVFARLWDGKNAGNYASVTVKDDIQPEKATVTFDSTTITEGENITATVEQADNQSGVNIEACKWIFTASADEIGTDPNDYTEEMSGTFTSTSENIECEANTGGTYWLHVLTVDNANKPRETVSSTSVTVIGKLTQVGNVVTGSNKVYKDTNDEIAVIPAGYGVVSGLNKISDGLVITDHFTNGTSDGNEFVWIPVETVLSDTEEDASNNKAMAVNLRTATEPLYRGLLYNFTSTSSTVISECTTSSGGYAEPRYLWSTLGDGGDSNTVGITSASLQEEYAGMIESVIKNKGFYISRYEMSLDSSNKAQSKKNATSATPAATSANKWYGLYDKAKKYALKTDTSKKVVSSMIWGSQYDAMLNWMLKSGVNVKSTAPVTGASYNTTRITGSKESDKIKNVYDLLGNSWEFTMEGDSTTARVHRGGAASHNWTLDYRSSSNPYQTYDSSSTRIALYIK